MSDLFLFFHVKVQKTEYIYLKLFLLYFFLLTTIINLAENKINIFIFIKLLFEKEIK